MRVLISQLNLKITKIEYPYLGTPYENIFKDLPNFMLNKILNKKSPPFLVTFTLYAKKKFKFLVLIPARGGSKRIKNKNLKILNGKPLIDYTINTALKSKFHKNDIYVSSESDKIEKYIKSKKISFIKRPKELAKDTSSTFSVIKHFVQNIDKDFDF